MNHPIAFSDGSNAGHSRPGSECPSMKSEQSMNHPVAFSDGSGSSRSRDMKQRLCNIHNRPLDVLCKTDQDFICLICMMEEHKTDNERADGELSYLLKYVSRVPEKDNSLTFVEVAALGRPLHVGTLYDCRNDSFFSDDALWDVDTVSSSKVSLSQPHTDVRILEGDSLQDRLEALDLTTALRASVVSGLVNVKKAAAFLEHPAQSQLQDRITLHYRTSTRLELLGHRLLHSGAPLLVTNQNSATHVVVAVLYGGQSFFVFDKESDSSEGVQELKAAVSKMITCSNAAELLSEETSFASCKCSVYTDAEDFTLVDFKTAVTLYSCHQKLLGPQGEEGGPLKVWLYPLKNLTQTPAFVPQEISEDLLHKAENVLNHLEYLKADQGICLDTMSSFSNLFGITWFVALKNTLSKFSLLLKQYQRAFQRRLASCIKTIREKGEEGQENLRDLLRRNTQSPFNPQNLNQWLRNKEAEVRALNECRSANITIIKTQDDLKRVIEDSQAGGVLCFALTSLEGEDQFLSALKQHIHLLIMDNTQAAQAPFRLPDVSQKILSDLCSFLFTREVEEHAEKTTFIAACLPNERFPGSSIYLYQSGKVVSQNLKVDIKPAPVEIITVKQTCVTLKLQSLKMAFADRYRLEYKAVSCRGTTGTEPKWKAIEIWRTGSNVVVSGVNPGTHYQLRHAIMNSDSMSDYSRITEFQTLARARRGQPTVMKQKTGSLTISWCCAKSDVDSPVLCYMVEYSKAGLEGWQSVLTEGPECEYTITLPYGTCYRFRVSAVYEEGDSSKPSEETNVQLDVKNPLQLTDWTDVENEERTFLQCLPYISQLRFVELQQGTAAALLSALQDKLDFPCCCCLDLIEHIPRNTMSAEECRVISLGIQGASTHTRLIQQDCEIEDAKLKKLFRVLRTDWTAAKLPFLALVSVGSA